MAEIPKDLGSGGKCLAPEQGGPVPSLVTILNDVADDLAARSDITSADASDLATAITLVNEIKAALNTTVATTKEP